VDVYGLGTVLYYLLTRRRAYNLDTDAPGSAKEHPDWYRDRVLQGGYPSIPSSIETDKDGAVQAIVQAMKMALTSDAGTRPDAQAVADYLLEQQRAYIREQKYAYAQVRRLQRGSKRKYKVN
jgi:uncharacterized protein (UPF0297 family)